ncbi:magnesium transporter [bacterium]|nr:MAG: magnesium transporter [bacterium]RKZ18539.1 MAG: magnesium transporter [bacterium]
MSEELQELHEALHADLEAGAAVTAARRLVDLAPAEIADLFAPIDTAGRILLVRQMPAEQAAAVLSEIDDRSLGDVLELLQDREIVELLDTLPSDDAADLIGFLDEEDQDRVIEMLDRVDHQDAVEVKELLRYPEDSAGGVMAKEYLGIVQDQTAGAVQKALREMDEDELESMHYAFVIDDRGRLVGQVGLLKLLLSPPSVSAGQIMEPDPVFARVSDDQEEVANLIVRHDLVSLPVVDAEDRLVGRVTVDDAMDVLEEEATEDVARLAGSSAEEVGSTSVWEITRARLPWLLAGLAGQLLAAVVIGRFEASLQSRMILFFFIPMIMGTGGNTGIQTSSIMIRMLVTHDIDARRARRHLVREFLVAILIGVVLGGVMTVTLLLFNQAPDVGIIIGLSLVAVVLVAAMVGSTVPLFCERIGVDPTLATGPFITTTNDVVGLLIYLGIAYYVLQVW